MAITTTCRFGHNTKWHSQPLNKSRPWGNIRLASAMLFSGVHIAQTLRMFSALNLQCFSERTYFRMQRAYLVPVVKQVNAYNKIKSIGIPHEHCSNKQLFDNRFGTMNNSACYLKECIHSYHLAAMGDATPQVTVQNIAHILQLTWK